MPHLTPTTTTAPITSLCFLPPSHLLAGEASSVNVFLTPTTSTTSRLLHKRRIFARNRIHGIFARACGTQILFWGGKSIALVTARSLLLDEDVAVAVEIAAPDWVLSAAFLTGSGVVAVGAHNELMFYDGTWRVVSCECERTMLYSADLRVSGGSVVVAAGTVFGEILVWEEGRPVRRLRGHEGSVFATRIEEGGRWVASCSDDRTVRVWDLLDTLEDGGEGRETTGFADEAKGGRGCIALGWGHQARPWGVRFLPAEGEKVQVVTVAEDLTARFWSVVPNSGETRVLENTQTWMLHQGKSIWSFALEEGSRRIATGGNDGRVGLLDYSDDAEMGQEWSLEDVTTSPPEEKKEEAGEEPVKAQEKKQDKLVKRKKKKNKPKDSFKNYAVVDSETFVVITVFGQISLYNMQEKSWRSLGIWEALKNWSVVGAWKGTGILAVGGIEGKLGILDIDNGREWWWDAGGRGKVADIFVGEKDGDHFQVVTTSVGHCAPVLHTFSLQQSEPPTRNATTLLTPSAKFTVTSILITPIHQLFLGSRSGDLAVYTLPPPCSSESELNPTAYHPALYSTDAITSLTLSPTSPTTLHTTSFSGLHTTHTLPSLAAIHISKPGAVTIITGLFFTPTQELTIFGFRGTRFIVHNTATHSDTFTIDCGGAHRAWIFSAQASWLIWTQASRLHLQRALRPRLRILKHGSHGREIKAAAYAEIPRLLATGAEDTTIRVGRVGAEAGAVMIKRHTTGVLSLAWDAAGERLFSSGGVEELVVFRVRVADDATVGVVEESCLPVPKSQAEVRICGLDVAMRDAGERYDVVAGMSDGAVKLWVYTPANRTWALRTETRYGTCCVLHTQLLEGVGVLVAATDGFLTIYNTALERMWTEKVHQSGVKALSAAVQGSEKNKEVRIYSGGDDCAVAATTVAVEMWVTAECKMMPSAHASAVTVVLPVSGGRVVTAGVDQKVKVWDSKWRRVEKVESAVADCSGAVLVRGEGGEEVVVVVGVGTEGWRVEDARI